MLSEPWRIEMLGALRAVLGDRVIERFTRRNVASLLARLAYPPVRNHSREQLVALLWPEASPRAGRHNLRQALVSLRKLLEPTGVQPGAVVAGDHSNISLIAPAIITDVAEFAISFQASSRLRWLNQPAESGVDKGA